ncbi:phage/plasmid primase, P4 family [Nitrososphaera sp.]|uniref:DNA primase family protein n=1 Tax=Nitrososphaera sp. TaxID=1971748 RepID=UPI002EDB7DDF
MTGDVLDAMANKLNAEADAAKRQARARKNQMILDTATAIMEKHTLATMRDTNEIYVKRGGKFWPALSLVREETESMLGKNASPSVKAAVTSHVQDLTRVDREAFDADLDVINFPNGIYRMSSMQFEPHPADFLSLKQHPFDYDADAQAARFDQFLDEVLYPEEKEPMLDALAYTFYREHVADVINLLVGLGANGKTVILTVAEALHGPDLTSHESLKSIMDSRFAKANLEGKNINVATETAKITYSDTATLKEITANTEQKVERKGIQGYNARLWAKIWSATNVFPDFDDDSDGMTRRLNIFDFPNRFEGEAEDPDLAAKLTTPESLAGIFNMLAPRIARIAETKRLIMAQKSIEERRRAAKLAKNPVDAFDGDCLREPTSEERTAGTDHELKDTVFKVFEFWCTANKVIKKSPDAFGRAMKNELGKRDARKVLNPGEKPRWIWQGVKLTDFARLYLGQTTITEQG